MQNELVHIIGTSKGRGFAGFVKRHHFRGGRATHGSMFHRAPGSIGSSAYPSRVLKGMRMAGHMGNERVTVQNLRVARIDQENNLLFVRGAVPGPAGGYVVVEKSGVRERCNEGHHGNSRHKESEERSGRRSWIWRTRYLADRSMKV